MNNNDGALSFDAYIKDTDFKRQLDEMQARIVGFSDKAVSETDKMDSAFRKLGAAVGTYLSFQALKDFGQEIINVRGDFQQLEIAFTTMLGSKQKANELMAQLTKTAATTPFDLQGIASGAKQLLAYGTEAKDVNDTLVRLGNIASGLSIPLSDMVYLYGTTQTQGRLYTQDLNQFLGRGIPLVKELAKQFGVSEDQVKGLVTEGKVGFPQVQKAIVDLTSKGGMFYNLMEEQSKSLKGQISNLGDAWDGMLNQIGKSNEGFISGGLSALAGLMDHYQQIIDIIKVLVATYGAYKAAVIVTTTIQAVCASGVGALTAAETLHYAALVVAEKAQKLLNATMLSNPYVLCATLLVGLITSVVLFTSHNNEATESQKHLNDAMARADDRVAESTAKLATLTTIIKSNTASHRDKEQALKDLIAISPEYFNGLTIDAVRTGNAQQAIDAYTESLRKKIIMEELEKEMSDSIKRENAAKNGSEDIGFWHKAFLRFAKAAEPTSAYDPKAAIADTNKRNKAEAIQTEHQTQEAIKKKMQETLAEDNKGTAKRKANSNSVKNTKITNAKTTADEEKKYAKGSLDYWQQIKTKAEDALGGISTSDAKYRQKQATYLNAIHRADKEIEAIENDRKSFAEQLDYKRKQYQLYEKWVTNIGKAAGDTQFKDLISGSKSYVDYLNAQIQAIESKQKAGTATTDDNNNLISLKEALQGETGAKSPIESFKDDLAAAKKEAGSLIEYLDLLKKKKEELSGDNSSLGLQKKQAVQEEENSATNEKDDYTKELLRNYQSFTRHKEELEKQCAADITLLESRLAAAKKANNEEEIRSIEDAIAARKKAKDDEIKEAEQTKIAKSKEYQQLQKDVERIGSMIVVTRKGDLDKELELVKEKCGEESELYKQLYAQIKNLQDQNLRSILQSIGDIGQAWGDLKGPLGTIGTIMNGIASQSQNLFTAFSETASTTDKIGAAISGVATIVGDIASTAQANEAAEREWYMQRITLQDQYNLALNEELRLKSQNNESIFVEDYIGRLKDGIAAYNDATEKFAEKLKEIREKGQTKLGLRNSMDWGTVAKDTAAGAAAGAAIGSIVPVIGTAVGAVVGGVVGFIGGLFGGHKKKTRWGSLLAEYPELVSKTADGEERINTALAKQLIDQNVLNDETKEILQTALDYQTAMDEAVKQMEDVISDLAGQIGEKIRTALVSAFEDGTDAAKAFGDAFTEVIEDTLSQLIFSAVFSERFKKLQDEMLSSYKVGGDDNWIDDFGRFFQDLPGLSDQFFKALQDAQNAASAYGLTLWKKKDDTESEDQLSGSVKSLSEDTGSTIAGQITMMRIIQAEYNENTKVALVYFAQIAYNTAFCGQRLTDMLRVLNDIKGGSSSTDNTLRAKGLV